MLNADGDTLNTIQGSADAGIHTVRWNFRGPRPEAAEPGPYEKQERERTAARARIVADSVIAAGWDEQMVNRMLPAFTGEGDSQAIMRMFRGEGGGGGGSGDPEEFRERPAERVAGAGGQRSPDYGQMRELAELINPGQGMRGLRRGGGGQAEMVGPGSYTVTLKVGERTFTQTLVVERAVGLWGNSSGF